MKRIQLGKIPLKVSRLGLGGIQFSKISVEETCRIIHYACDLGINFIETARGYFDSEEKIGRAIKGIRNGLVLASKAGGKNADNFAESINQSLKAFCTDHIDIYQFHGVDREEDLDGIMGPGGALEVAEKAIRQGKIGHIALSTHSLEIARKIVEEETFSSIQLPISFINYEVEESGILEQAAEKGIAMLAMKPFGGGRLENARLCLGYVYSLPDVVPLIGVDNVEQVDELVRLTDEEIVFDKQDLREIERIKRTVGTRFCRACRYCEPCPEGISIYGVLYFPVYLKQLGLEKVLSGSAPQKVEKSNDCTECGKCEERCPFDLSIIEGMKYSRQLLEEAREKSRQTNG